MPGDRNTSKAENRFHNGRSPRFDPPGGWQDVCRGDPEPGIVTPDDPETVAEAGRRCRVPVLRITSGRRIALIGPDPEDVRTVIDDPGPLQNPKPPHVSSSHGLVQGLIRAGLVTWTPLVPRRLAIHDSGARPSRQESGSASLPAPAGAAGGMSVTSG